MAIQLNKSAYGLQPTNQQLVFNPPIASGSSGSYSVGLTVTAQMMAPAPGPGQQVNPSVQAAIKNMSTNGVFYFAAPFPLERSFSPTGGLDRTTFINAWKSIDDTKEVYSTVTLPPGSATADAVIAKYASRNIYQIARRPVPNAPGQEVVYFSARTFAGHEFLAELTFKGGVEAAKVCFRTEAGGYQETAKEAFERCARG